MRDSLPRLPAAHLEALLGGDWETTGPLRLNEDLNADAVSASVLFVNVRRLLEAVRQMGGAPATADGRFTPSAVQVLVARLWWGAGGEREPLPGDAEPESERDVRPLQFTRIALEIAGLLGRAADRLFVTQDGARLLEGPRGGELYARLFRAYFRTLDHSRVDLEPAIPQAWRHVSYALWVIGQLGSDWWDPGAFLNALLPPDVLATENRRLAELRERSERIIPSVQELFLMRLLEPLEDFAIVESSRADPDARGCPIPRYRRGRLYERVLRFDFG